MGTHGRSSSSSKKKDAVSSSSKRRSRKSNDSESESYSDDSDSQYLTPKRSSGKQIEGSNRSKSSHRSRSHSRRRTNSEDDTSSSEDSDRGRKKKKSSSRHITEEEIAEYLAKKAQKKAVRVAKKLKTQTVSGYSNDSNPFGDSSLNEKFVWRKKIERDVTQGVPLDAFSVKSEKKRQKERMV